MATIEQLDKNRIPQSVAIIMDGNGRWAKARGYERSVGHKAGVDALHNTLEAAKHIGIKYLTVYTFSTENWNRPKQEVDTLMNLIAWGVERETPGMIKNGVRLQVMGELSRLPEFAYNKLRECENRTKEGKDITLVIALSYSSRWEITDTVQRLAQKCVDGELQPQDITEEVISQNLHSAAYPDPDLLIRTGGELRISNYLLWQISYSELYFCDVLWPDFGEAELCDAVLDYQSRERRFGKTSAQVQQEHANAQ